MKIFATGSCSQSARTSREHIVEHITFSERKMVNKASKSKGLITLYRNNFHSGMSFVPELSSYCIHVIKSTGSALGVLVCVFFFFLPDQISMRHSPPNYTICHFQSGTKFVFSLHDTRMKFRTRKRILFGMKTGMTVTLASCK